MQLKSNVPKSYTITKTYSKTLTPCGNFTTICISFYLNILSILILWGQYANVSTNQCPGNGTLNHTLITWPLASEQTLLFAIPQCVGILLTFFIIQVTCPFDVWK